MSLPVLLGLLSGLLTGAIAAALRRFVLWIVVLPVMIAPIAYLYWWRDGLSRECMFASSYPTEACAQTRAFVETTLFGLPQAGLGAITHLAVAAGLALTLMLVRHMIDWAMREPEAERAAEDEEASNEDNGADQIVSPDKQGLSPQPA